MLCNNVAPGSRFRAVSDAPDPTDAPARVEWLRAEILRHDDAY